jgi:hypothetical protein
LKHVIGRLSAGSAGLLGVIKKLGEVFGAVLRAFNTGMEAILGHSDLGGLAIGKRIHEFFTNQ